MGLKGATPLADAPFSRSETEVRVPRPDPDINLFGEEISAELNRVIDGHPLEQKFETQIKRRLRCLNLERSQLEVAFDEGFIVVGDRRQPLTEVELELKAGEETALYDFAARLTDALPVCLEIMSKAERGFMLAADDHPMPVRAEALKFPTDATLDQAVEIVINDALGQFVANWPALTETHDRESIREIAAATAVPLTLHGGSGTDDDDFQKAISAGITIVHISTELRLAWRQGLEAALAENSDEVVPYKVYGKTSGDQRRSDLPNRPNRAHITVHYPSHLGNVG
jgi:hypothetical protein